MNDPFDLTIRTETTEDVTSIRAITQEAFETSAHSEQKEHQIIDALRKDNALTLSLVAQIDQQIVGHLAISPVAISDGCTDWFGLGPISVVPEAQNQGIGSMLMDEALHRLRNAGARGCVVLGEPGFYTGFDFVQHPNLIFRHAPPEYFLAICFDNHWPQGEVTYHPAFYA